MKNSIEIYKFLLVLTVLIFTFQIQAQTEKELLAQLAAEEQEAVNALVLYPKDTRLAILEASLYPEALIKMESIQLQTSVKFKDLMQSYPQEVQESVWDLTRYPNLLERLATADNSTKAVDKILAKYPKIIHQRARQVATNSQALIMQVNEMNQSAANAFAAVVEKYPPKVQANLRQLLELPEVLTLLTENIRLTILVGDLYEKEPDWVIQKADSVSLEVARQNAQEIEDWKQNLANNPQAMEELQAATESFNDDYEYDDAYYNFDNEQETYDEIYYDDDDDYQTIKIYHEYNYPYWFGCPYWYNAPRWRVYPYWYDWGFYYGNSGSIVVVGLPSFYFVNWYFYYPIHHTYWSHLSTHFVRHHHHHIHHRNSITTGVNRWRDRNQEIINDDWVKDDGKLSNRLAEYGKFETARTKYNNKHTDRPMTQKEYADQHAKRYPTVTKSAKKVEKSRPNPVYKVPPISRKPTERKTEKPTVRKPKTTKPNTVKVPERKPTKKPKTIPKVNKAKEYHKNTWEKQQPSRNKVTRPTSPRTRTKMPKTTTKKTKRPTTTKRKKNN